MKKHKVREQQNQVKLRRGFSESFFGMWQAVLVASLNKGQFPIAIVCFVFVVMILKMPGKRVADLANRILELMADGSLVGYAVAAVLAAWWAIHSKAQRKLRNDEMERIGKEKTKLQEELLGRALPSSDRR